MARLGSTCLEIAQAPLQGFNPPMEQMTLPAGAHKHHTSHGAAFKGKSSSALSYQGQSQKHWITIWRVIKKVA